MRPNLTATKNIEIEMMIGGIIQGDRMKAYSRSLPGKRARTIANAARVPRVVAMIIEPSATCRLSRLPEIHASLVKYSSYH
jgi:hypothetical protein